MVWHLDILPPDQAVLWREHLSAGIEDFVLYGGTALALRLGHRKSEDFDFFSSHPFNPLAFKDHLGLEGEVLDAAPNTLSILCRGVKISFFGGLSLRRINPPDLLDGCPVASLDDLAATKLAALVNRVEPKDFLDVAALLRHGVALPDMVSAAVAVYRGDFPVQACLKSLAYFDLPSLDRLTEADRQILETAALSVEQLPARPIPENLIS